MRHRLERGSCFCGSIVAEMEGEPFWINYDHDDDCRKALGSPLTIWIGYRREQVRFTSGIPKSFSKTSGVQRTFCAECGSSISYMDEGLKDEIWLTIGFMDRPERFEPKAHGFWRMKLPWIQFADELPRSETYTRQRDPTIGYPSDRKTK
ncbi:GFA family protein [Mesorhizobium sp.]|uniref:GFA family protein n=1 Tax=Mesorhizobium sp. TaxID=1871066 RepID=UPI000FE5F81F|nr:GFA family protein [Mesorhizobium sp.]RWP95754.1 MAG: GFA family protein [Mesorhizobium sp.]RWQ27615.1 MAG: GFA family protein [Mesorhizobium sp.]TIL56791.1 MAG: GFA family protein [Mesorhizobium sp.]TIM45037.1 MAG: GFA family protein [Mesorhizobium sp.]